MMYIKNNSDLKLEYSSKHKLDLSLIKTAIEKANIIFEEATKSRHKYDPANFIPLRNFSGGVGEAFAAILSDMSDDMIANPHPDGYPDILPNIDEIKPWLDSPTRKDFLLGGFDIKARYVGEGDRVDTNASAHHNHTKSVLNIIWEWRNNSPFIIGITFMNDLTPSDWTELKPAREGSKSTPACSLNGSGKKKLRKNWLFLHESVMSRLSNKKEWL